MYTKYQNGIHSVESWNNRLNFNHSNNFIFRKEAQTWLSTGWYTIIAALDICQEVTVYGMADENYCTRNG